MSIVDASQNGDIALVKALVNSGADVNMTDRYGYTALIKAAMNGHIEIAKFLLKNGANVYMIANGKTPLEFAYQSKTPPALSFFLVHAIQLRGGVMPTYNLQTSLEMMKLLILYGARK